MSGHKVIIPEGHNLSVYFLLPLIGLNKNSFNGFLNSHLSYNGKLIVELSRVADECWEHDCYITDFTLGGKHFIVYKIPDKFASAVSHFLDSRYSRFSDEVKLAIYTGSGLPVNQEQNGKLVTHNLLLALDQHPNLRVYLEEKLNVTLAPDDELLPKLDLDKEIMDIDTDILCNTM